MAPDSRFWRHQLWEATFRLQRTLLKAAVPVCAILALSATNIEARTEPTRDAWNDFSASVQSSEKTSQGESLVVSSASPSNMIINSSPAGRWSTRNQIHIPNHPVVNKYIRFYKGEGRVTFLESLERSRRYLPIMTEILESYGVPAELVYVAMVESCFKRQATCRGAGGYWQLLAATARSMGLRVDRWVDERKDPIKSTQAAAKYLRSFYRQYHSWPLALAAYNAGDRPISKALRNCKSSDFWEISGRGKLPHNTRAYVPKVFAAIQVMRDLEANGFETPRYSYNSEFEPIWVQSSLKLEDVAQWLDTPLSRLQDLNPSLRLDRLPPDGGGYLNVPSGAKAKFGLAYQNFLRN